MNTFDKPRMEVIEDALRTLPAAPAPPALQNRIMSRVRRLSAAPSFSFPWLGAAVSLMLSTFLTGVAYVALSVPPATLLRAAQALRLFFVLPVYRPFIAAAVPGFAMLAVCGLLAILLFQPRPRIRRSVHR